MNGTVARISGVVTGRHVVTGGVVTGRHVVTGGVVTGRNVAARRTVALHRAAVMRGGAVMERRRGISPRRRRGGRNVGRRQLGFRLNLRRVRLIDGRGLLRPKRRRNQKCGTGQRDT